MNLRTGLLAVAVLGLSGPVLAAEMKTYQVTGPVTDVSPDAISVKKGADIWQLGRGADTKVTGDVKKGDKVTVMYRMTATSIEVKGAAASGKPAAKSGGAKPAAN
jgi:hypothetical protein